MDVDNKISHSQERSTAHEHGLLNTSTVNAIPTHSSKGFTLIELLVVTSIISLLSSIITSNLTVVRETAYEAKIVQDLKIYQTALELYYQDHRSYPKTIPHNVSANDHKDTPPDKPWDLVQQWIFLGDALQPLVDEKYLPDIPHYPSWPNNYIDGAYNYNYPWAGRFVCETKVNDRPTGSYTMWVYYPKSYSQLTTKALHRILDLYNSNVEVPNWYCID